MLLSWPGNKKTCPRSSAYAQIASLQINNNEFFLESNILKIGRLKLALL